MMLPASNVNERQCSLAQTKARILGVLRGHDSVSLDQLLLELRDGQIADASEVKAAVWVLIAEQMVELTAMYDIKPGPAFPVAA